MASELRIASLNLRAMPNRGTDHVHRLASLIASHDCDVVLLQECRPSWLEIVCNATETTGVHSHWMGPETPSNEFSPDGCAIAVRRPVEITRTWRIQPENFMPEAVQRHIPEEPPANFKPMPERLAMRYSGRSALAEIQVDGRSVVVCSFHGTPGTGKVGGKKVDEWKPFFPGAVAVELAKLKQPFVFGLDANEPLAETLDSITFHWEDGRSGVEKAKALLGLDPMHSGRDLFRERLTTLGGEPASSEVLLETYTTRSGSPRRFDSIWATPQFQLLSFETHLGEVVASGGDHAMLLSELRLT